MTGITVGLLTASIALCAVGFVACTASAQGKMPSPGAFWTPSIAAFIPASYLVGVPPTVLAANFGVLLVTATFWAFDAANRAKEATR